MSFNTHKCKTLRITTKRNPIDFTHHMGNDALDIGAHHPYLGVELSSNLKWTNHVNDIVVKASNALWFLCRNLGRCT